MTDFDPQAMDDAAAVAENELADMPEDTVELIAQWMYRWYMKAGYKRLGRILVGVAKETKEV